MYTMWMFIVTVLQVHIIGGYGMTHLLTKKGGDVILPFQHQSRCNRAIRLCRFPLYENGFSQTEVYDCQSSSCEVIVACKERSKFETSGEFRQRIGVIKDDDGLMSDILFNISAKDAGIYYFCPSWKVEVEQKIMLVVQEGPTTPRVKVQDVPILGKKLTITCMSESRSLPVNNGLKMTFSWKRNGNGLDKHPEMIFSGPHLTINNLTLNYEGTGFSCRAKEEEGMWTKESQSYIISVQYGPEKVNMMVTESDDNVTKVTCSADCRPPCKVTFRKNNSILTSGTNQTSHSIKPVCDDKYKCEARNIHAIQRQSLVLCNHQYKPVVKTLLGNNVSTSVTVRENDSVHLSCAVIGRPEPVISWQVANLEVGQSRALLKTSIFQPAYIANGDVDVSHQYLTSHVITGIQCVQTGRYYCKAENGRGFDEKYIDVIAPCYPKIVTMPVTTVQTGDALNLDIIVMSITPPSATCRRVDDVTTHSCSMNVTVTSQENHSSLYNVTLTKETIQNIDKGEYVVTVTNDKGMVEKNFTLEVQDLRVGQSSLPAVLSGVIVSLVCAVCVVMVIVIYIRRRRKTDVPVEGANISGPMNGGLSVDNVSVDRSMDSYSVNTLSFQKSPSAVRLLFGKADSSA